MTTFVSTRGGGPVSLADALFAGLAPDGGLFVPTTLGRLDAPPAQVHDLADTARWAGPRILPETDRAVLERLLRYCARLCICHGSTA